ncbi:MAG: hypothetical protein NZM40_04425 [Sphingomonadaceae bacterium]|uniref:hypothetical protein n=1 Tax=Thermaurantiacus sp. TaxID=2820283 RepID=UPI00298EED13|nr:hypothetical protein [Thermaurantiacus sp.]MCS6986667.1 hypothetical protein [Sphingomonadaceae bacterium]MDW8414071.1 hypothetical protein [Thermaurantiacus sp.]
MRKMLAAAAIALFPCTMAHAAIVTVQGSFTASGWELYFAPPEGQPQDPIDPLFLSFSVTFDDELT